MRALLVGVVLALAPGDAARAAGLDVRSANGRFRAELRGEELVVDELRAGEAARRQWSGRHACAGPYAHFLTDDGAVFVHVASDPTAKPPLVESIRRGLRSAAFDAGDLELDASASPWIDLGLAGNALRLRRETNARGTLDALDLLGSDGRVRTIDLAHGALALSPLRSRAAGPGDGPHAGSEDAEAPRDVTQAEGVRVEPAPPSGGQRGEPVYVANTHVAPLHREGATIEVEVEGSFPTPDWKLSGFEIERDAATRDLVLRPLGVAGGGVSAQLVRSFRAVARIAGLEPGRHRGRLDGRPGSPALENRGREAAFEFEIVPSDLVVSLRASGGIANITRAIRLYADGRFETAAGPWNAPARVALAPVAEWRALERVVAALPPSPEKIAPSAGSDFMAYEVVWPTTEGPRRVVRDDGSLGEPFRGIVRALEELAAPREPAPARPRYRFDATTSSLSIATKSSGPLGAFGHDHVIAAREFSGAVDLERERLDAARLELSIVANSLAVVDARSPDDAAAIDKELRGAVLDAARYPEIVFASTRAVVTPLGDGTSKVALTGDLTLHGKTRALTIPVSLSFEGDVLHASGKVKLRQTDWNIRPASAAGGTIKVADEIELSFVVVARR